MQRLRRLLPPAAMAVLVFFLLHMPAAIAGVRAGMAVSVTSVVPSLFVFSVAADLLVSLTGGSLRPLSPKMSAFLLGTLCGFPVGAVVCERMCKSGAMSARDAARLAPFVNNASPAFLLGAAGSLFGDGRIGAVLFAAQFCAAAVCCLPLRMEKGGSGTPQAMPPPADALFGAVDRSVAAMLRVTALICLFSALLAVLRGYIRGDAPFAALATLLEIGSGTARCAELFGTSPRSAALLSAFGCGWSGFCVHAQVLSVLKSAKVKYTRFLLCKAGEGVLCAIFAFCLCKFVLGY